MATLGPEKQERIIESVRRGLEGDAALAFVHQSGYALTPLGLAKQIRSMGGRGRLLDLIHEGKTNVEILQTVLPRSAERQFRVHPPSQEELFKSEDWSQEPLRVPGLWINAADTTKLTIRLPNDVCQALTIAARMEGVNRNQLVVDLLTRILSQTPDMEQFKDENPDGE